MTNWGDTLRGDPNYSKLKARNTEWTDNYTLT